MFKKADAARDAFAFSRGGLTVTASYVAVPVVAGDRINRARDERIARARARAARERASDNQDCGPGAAPAAQTA